VMTADLCIVAVLNNHSYAMPVGMLVVDSDPQNILLVSVLKTHGHMVSAVVGTVVTVTV